MKLLKLNFLWFRQENSHYVGAWKSSVHYIATSSNMATAFPACSSRGAKPYGRHRPPNTPVSNLKKDCQTTTASKILQYYYYHVDILSCRQSATAIKVYNICHWTTTVQLEKCDITGNKLRRQYLKTPNHTKFYIFTLSYLTRLQRIAPRRITNGFTVQVDFNYITHNIPKP